VTINFSNGMIAITDANGEYIRTGLSSGFVDVTVDLAGTDCSLATPTNYPVFLNISNVYDRNFVLDTCIDVAATNAQATNYANGTATNVAGTATYAAATATAGYETAVAETATAALSLTPGETAAPTETATTSPTCSEAIVSPFFSQVDVISPSPALAQSDGTSEIQVLVRLFNECNNTNNMAGLPVQLSSSRAEDLIAPGGTNADGAGEATFAVVSSVMSVWNADFHDFESGTFTASSGATTINETAGGSFVCVGSKVGVDVNTDQVTWTMINDSGIDRRLNEMEVSWSQGFDLSRWLSHAHLDALLIWAGVSFNSPTTITNADWNGAPADRQVAAGATKNLVLTYSFPVTGGQTFTLIPKWVNTSGTSLCTSNTVVVTR
jgi:hypothetical protein